MSSPSNSIIICSKIIKLVNEVLSEANVDDSHDVNHAIKVYHHVEKALALSKHPKEEGKQTAIKIAALLHDVDDEKYFPTHTNNENARSILETVRADSKYTELIIEMINMVSCKKNGNNNPYGPEDAWKLYPRYADRLEAMGRMGIYRAWAYSKIVDRPLFLRETPRFKSEIELGLFLKNKTLEDYMNSKGKSVSFIDHCYDKLLFLKDGIIVDNPYFTYEAMKRHVQTINYVLLFGETGMVDERLFTKLRIEFGNN